MVSKRTMSGGDGRTEPGFVFPVDAPKCCQHHVRRRRKEKRRDENQALYSTRGQLPAGRTRKTQLFYLLPAGRNKTGTVHENTKLKFVAGWPTNKQTQKHKAKRKITKGEDSRVRVHSQSCRKRSAFSVSVAPPFFSVSPTLLAALPDPV